MGVRERLKRQLGSAQPRGRTADSWLPPVKMSPFVTQLRGAKFRNCAATTPWRVTWQHRFGSTKDEESVPPVPSKAPPGEPSLPVPQIPPPVVRTSLPFCWGEPDRIPTPPRRSVSPFCGEKGDDHREDARARMGTGTSNTSLVSLNLSCVAESGRERAINAGRALLLWTKGESPVD